jgi:hypothetical protein
MYQKLVFFTVLKFKWSIIAIFILAIISGVCLRYIQFKRSHHKFEGSVTLFYTPRACEEVKPLSINHILGVFSRQQIFHQLFNRCAFQQLQHIFFGVVRISPITHIHTPYTQAGSSACIPSWFPHVLLFWQSPPMPDGIGSPSPKHLSTRSKIG